MKHITILIAWSVLYCGVACATTQQEQTVLKAPMPHQTYTGGAAVAVHRARLEGYFEGKNGNAALLAQLKQEVQQCTKSLADSGRTLHPPTAWPEYVMLHREETYTAANRSIRYTTELAYGVSKEDCSLLAPIVSKAVLASSKGVCKIDISNKTARGDCDSSGHADAAPERRAAAQPPAQVRQRMAAANPALAALLPPASSGQRTILGVRCNVFQQAANQDGDVSTLCYAIGGAFLPLRAVDKDGFGGLLLESTTPHGYQLKAVEARLDTAVGSAVFMPYARGYAVNAGAAP
ncbi:hypothetical protein KW842_09800 [Duganella sp. sic0402]|uniref:hypothetical protein n=1 Tax=Duganella sp. sic0402 TaxID=2854786 RepID=UPI001C44E5D6|nr:hypothetical protein [Duganella sp. sic0402]MBV7536057.1 hypothetical protein [Duganella sp. sic0402]